jgi:hypothetical protein
VNAYRTVLYLHLLSLFVMVGGITVVGVCYFRLRAAGSLVDAAPWANLADQVGWVFPLSILGLFASGGVPDERHVDVEHPVDRRFDRWSRAGNRARPTRRRPACQTPQARAGRNAVGPLDERARRLTRDPALWIVILANPGIVLGITWDMTVKPGTAGAIAAVLAGYAVGAVAARPLTSRSRSVDWGR